MVIPVQSGAFRGRDLSFSAYWALPASSRYRQLVTLWFGVFCGGFCVWPGEPVQRALFYVFVPLTLPAGVATVRRIWVAPLTWALAAFLAYSAVSALWSDNWLSAGDALRKSLWLGYFLVLCCAVGEGGPEAWWRVMRGVTLFAAAFAVYSIVEFRLTCPGCARLIGFGARANANYTAMVAGTIGLLGLGAEFSRTGRRGAAVIVGQMPICGLLLMTGGRAALLGYTASLLLGAALVATRGGWARAARVVPALCVALAAVAAGVAWLGGGWLREEIGRGDTYRLQIWAGNLARVRQRPWFGHGSTAPDDFAIGGSVVGHHAHNLFLAQAFYGGVVGLALWLAVFGLAIAGVTRVWRATGDVMPAVALGFLLAVGMVDIGYVVVDVQAIWLYVWVVLGIALSYDVARRRAAASA
jgi:O-antigen ligase